MADFDYQEALLNRDKGQKPDVEGRQSPNFEGNVIHEPRNSLRNPLTADFADLRGLSCLI